MSEDFKTITKPLGLDKKYIWQPEANFDDLIQNEIRNAVFDFMTSADFAIDVSGTGKLQMRMIAAEPIDDTVLSIDLGALFKREWGKCGYDLEWKDALKAACAEIIGE
jgi:hypothetical protein